MKDMDAFGASLLTGFMLILGLNQVVIALTNQGLQPVFAAGIRSVGSGLLIWGWMLARGIPVRFDRHAGPGLAVGAIFTAEFVFLFVALDLTTVARTSILFYSMPVWLAAMTHFVLPGDAMTRTKAAGLVLAFAGSALAILVRGTEGRASLVGDLCAVGAAIAWAGMAVTVRATKLREESAEMQLLWQLAISAPALLLLAFLFGPFIRDFEPWHAAGMLFQIVCVSGFGFLLWLWLLSIYAPSAVASFSFLTPVFGVGLGWWLLDEPVGWALVLALAMVAGGLVLVNRPAR